MDTPEAPTPTPTPDVAATPAPTPTPEDPSKEKPLAMLRDWGPWFLAIGPAVAFLLGFTYERGFAIGRGLPTDIVTVRPESIAWGIGALGFAALVLDISVKMALRFVPGAKDAGGAEKSIALAMWTFALVLLVVNLRAWGMPAVIFVIGLVFWLIGRSKNKSALTPDAAEAKPAKPAVPDPPALIAYRGAAGRAAMFVFPLLAVTMLVERKGEADALNQHTFLVYTDDEIGEMVVLRSYGDFAVAAKLDRDASTVGPGYKVLALDELASGAVREKLGLLETAEPVDTTDDEETAEPDRATTSDP